MAEPDAQTAFELLQLARAYKKASSEEYMPNEVYEGFSMEAWSQFLTDIWARVPTRFRGDPEDLFKIAFTMGACVASEFERKDDG